MTSTPGTDPVPAGDQGDADDASQKQFMTRFLDIQEQEMQLRAEQLEFDRQKDTNALEYGKAALDAQERDRKDTRQCARDEKRDTHTALIRLALIVGVLICVAFYFDKDEAAMEIIKALVFLSAGAFAGAGWERRKKRSSEADPEET